jgi:Protein of unknown function (DUF4239)
MWRKTIMSSLKNANYSFHEFYISLKSIISDLTTNLKNLFPSSHIYFLPAVIYIFKALEPALPSNGVPQPSGYLSQFIERFGVVYGILLPLILVRAWEQLDELDRAFDKEADAVKTFYDEVFFLRGENKFFAEEIVKSLRKYVFHIINNYQYEMKKQGVEVEEKVKGDKILEGIMKDLKSLFRTSGLRTKGDEIIIPKLIDKLNDIIDLRGDRIALASQRLFESLHVVTLIASIIFVLPFYFESFTPDAGIFTLENTLTFAVTLLVVVIFIFIEDLDEPFEGTFKIDNDSWQRILVEMDSPERKLELENLDQPSREKPVIWHSRETDRKKKTVRKTDKPKSRTQKKVVRKQRTK